MRHSIFGLHTLRRARLAAGLAAALACASHALAWWNGDWNQRKLVTLDTTATGGAIGDPIGGTPVLLRLSDGNFNFAAARSDGSDLRFVAADDRTPLAFHIERFDATMNEAFVWVQLPEVKAGARTTFWLYFSNPGKGGPAAPEPKATYDADTALVYHFAERDRPPADSSPAGNNGQTIGLTAEGSMIGPGLRIDGKTTVSIPAAASLFWTEGAGLTWSAWIKPAVLAPNAVVFSRRDAAHYFLIGLDRGAPFVEVTHQGGTVRSPAGAPVAVNSWHHLAVVASGEKIALYLDGEPYGVLTAPLPGLNGPAVLGGDGVGGGMSAPDTYFGGELDELEISRVARPAGFIKFAALSQGGEKAAKVIGFGSDEAPTSWFGWLKGGYIGVIIGSLTVDGWIVIGFLFVMLVISWIVMVSKAAYLNQVSRGNALFLKQWSQVATDLSVLDGDDLEQIKTMGGQFSPADLRAMHRAPLYRIYHIGVEEIRHRLNADRSEGSKKAISARSIQAIRASLDGGLVREGNKLSNQMVLLTIAISGGPFLGLLGTVVGVMITFAAVAQAGDVNVNAIAPGIAAALAATVAGLAVAIPALFGYNYLLTRIKTASSDMHVFIDEFVTKLAEFYRGRTD